MKVTVFIILISFSVAEAQSLRDLPGTALNGELRFKAVDFLKGYGVKEETLVWQQVISKYFPRLGGAMAFKTSRRYSVGVLGNMSKIEMFRNLLGSDSNKYRFMNRVPYSMVQLKVKDLSKYVGKVNGEFQYSNVNTFQLITTSPIGSSRIRKMVIDELVEFSGLEVSLERQRKKCLVLGVMDSALIGFEGDDSGRYWDVDSVNFAGMTVEEAISFLVECTDFHYSPYPIVDETHFKGRLGAIHFAFKADKYEDVDKALSRFGMYLRLEERIVDVLIIREAGYQGPPQPYVRELNFEK